MEERISQLESYVIMLNYFEPWIQSFSDKKTVTPQCKNYKTAKMSHEQYMSCVLG